MIKEKRTAPTSVVERAVDFHMIHVLGSHKFQRCIHAIWRGDIQIQYCEDNSHMAVPYPYLVSRKFWDHYDPRRMQGPKISYLSLIAVPVYKNIHSVIFSFMSLLLYTICVNTQSQGQTVGISEGLFFLLSISFFTDEGMRVYIPSLVTDLA